MLIPGPSGETSGIDPPNTTQHLAGAEVMRF